MAERWKVREEAADLTHECKSPHLKNRDRRRSILINVWGTLKWPQVLIPEGAAGQNTEIREGGKRVKH